MAGTPQEVHLSGPCSTADKRFFNCTKSDSATIRGGSRGCLRQSQEMLQELLATPRKLGTGLCTVQDSRMALEGKKGVRMDSVTVSVLHQAPTRELAYILTCGVQLANFLINFVRLPMTVLNHI